MGSYCPGCGDLHEEDDQRLCPTCAASGRMRIKVNGKYYWATPIGYQGRSGTGSFHAAMICGLHGVDPGRYQLNIEIPGRDAFTVDGANAGVPAIEGVEITCFPKGGFGMSHSL